MSARSDNHDPAQPHHPAGNSAPPSTLQDRVRALRLPDRMSAGRMRSTRLPWVLCVVLLLTSAAFGYRAFQAGRSDKPKTEDTTREAADSGYVALESKGYIIAAHQIQVSPKVNGMVLELYIEEGQRVYEGDVLAQLETVDYEASYHSARAHLDQSQARVRSSNAKYDQAVAKLEQARANVKRAAADLRQAMAHRVQTKNDLERVRQLYARNAISGADYDAAKAADDTAEAAVGVSRAAQEQALAAVPDAEAAVVDARAAIRDAEAAVLDAQANLDRALWLLDSCTVRAPVTGTILSKKAEKGNIVNPIAFNISASLCDMADLADLEVELTIQERDISQVFKGQKCRITPEAYPDQRYEGYVSRLMPTADRAKGAIPVRVKITSVKKEDEGVYLKPDMGAIVSFLKAGK